jgi:hypothetical protein
MRTARIIQYRGEEMAFRRLFREMAAGQHARSVTPRGTAKSPNSRIGDSDVTCEGSAESLVWRLRGFFLGLEEVHYEPAAGFAPTSIDREDCLGSS